MSGSIQVSPERLRSLAQTCTTEANNVGTVRTNVGNAIRNTGWKSPAATRFENDWNGKYVKALQDLERSLTELGTAAKQMAANYDSTEAAYKGLG